MATVETEVKGKPSVFNRETEGSTSLKRKLFREVLLPLAADRIYRGTVVQYTPDFKETYQQAVAEGYSTLGYSNHTSIPDGMATLKVYEQIKAMANEVLDEKHQVQKFYLPIAASLAAGRQNPIMTDAHDFFENTLRERGLDMIPYVRHVDKTKFEMARENLPFVLKVSRAPRRNIGIMMYPEGNQQGGRKRPDGKGINGMGRFEEGSIELVYEIWQRQEAKTLFIPYGISGGYKLIDPTTYYPPLRSILATLALRSPHIVRVRVGTPIRSDRLTKEMGKKGGFKPGEINNYLGLKVSCLLPESERGIYRGETFLEPGEIKSLGDI